MSGFPVTIVESGGVPVREVDSGAPAMNVVPSGGIAVTLSDYGPPFVLVGNEADITDPQFTSADPSGTFPESDGVISYVVAWNDPQSDLSIEGDDAGDPVITVLTSTSAQVEIEIDYEVKAAYSYTERLTDLSDNTTSREVNHTITDVEPVTFAAGPTITGTVNDAETVAFASTLAGSTPTTHTRTVFRAPPGGLPFVQLATGDASTLTSFVINAAAQGWDFDHQLVLQEVAENSEEPPAEAFVFATYIGNAPGMPELSGTAPPTAVVGQSYSFTPTRTGGNASFTFSLLEEDGVTAAEIPRGWTFNTTTGALESTAVEDIPTPTLSLDFSTSLPTGVTFTRASVKRVMDNTGAVVEVAVDAPGFGYRLGLPGLTVEQNRTNNVTRSWDFSQTYWTKTNVTRNGGLPGPLTGVTATSFTCNTADGFVLRSGIGATGHSRGTWARVPSGTATAYIGGKYTVARHLYTLTTTWQRIHTIQDTTEDGGADYYLVDFRGGTATVVEIGHAQSESGGGLTSEIVTDGSTVTRSADISVMSGTEWTSAFNAAEGTIVAEFAANGSGNGSVFTIGDVTTSTNERMSLRAETLQARWVVTAGGGGTASLYSSASTLTPGFYQKVGAIYKANDFRMLLEGDTLQTDTSGALPTVDRLYPGTTSTNTALNGHLRSILYWDEALYNYELTAEVAA